MDFLKMTLSNINTSYKRCMTLPELENFMLTGKIEPGLEGQVMHLIDETPTSLLIDAVNQLAAKKSISAELIWKRLASVAAESMSPNKFFTERNSKDSMISDNFIENIKRKEEPIIAEFLTELEKLKENEAALIEFDRLDYQRTGARLVVNTNLPFDRDQPLDDLIEVYENKLNNLDVKAHLSLSGWNGHLIVALETGAKLTAESGEDMAKQLILAGIFSENLTVTSWKDDVDHAPSGREIIAIKSALNAYEKKLNGLT